MVLNIKKTCLGHISNIFLTSNFSINNMSTIEDNEALFVAESEDTLIFYVTLVLGK